MPARPVNRRGWLVGEQVLFLSDDEYVALDSLMTKRQAICAAAGALLGFLLGWSL